MFLSFPTMTLNTWLFWKEENRLHLKSHLPEIITKCTLIIYSSLLVCVCSIYIWLTSWVSKREGRALTQQAERIIQSSCWLTKNTRRRSFCPFLKPWLVPESMIHSRKQCWLNSFITYYYHKIYQSVEKYLLVVDS